MEKASIEKLLTGTPRRGMSYPETINFENPVGIVIGRPGNGMGYYTHCRKNADGTTGSEYLVNPAFQAIQTIK